MDEIFTLLFINTKLLLNSANGGSLMSFFKETIQLIFQVIICIVGIGGILAFFFRDRFKTLKAIKTMANTANSFMAKIVPDILQGFEKKEFIPKGTLAEWTKIVSANTYSTRSPKKLNEYGLRILKESGIGKIVDDNQEAFIKELESLNFKSPLDVETCSFYILKDKEKKDMLNPIKYYLYSHPDEDIDVILFVGAMHLSDKYLGKYPELLQDHKE